MTYKILIVDDEMIIRQGIEYMIDWSQENCEIVGRASNGRQALELAQTLHPDVVISDVVMPQMDGMELTRQLQEKHPEMKVIILSAHSDFDYVRSTFTSGAVDYILKPDLSPDKLRESLHKVLRLIPAPAQGALSPSAALSRFAIGYQNTLDPEQFPAGSWMLLARPAGSEVEESTRFGVQLCEALRTQEKILEALSFNLSSSIQGILIQLPPGLTLSEARTLVQASWSSVFGTKDFAAFSGLFSDPQQLKRVYEDQVLPVLKEKFYLKDAGLRQLSDIPSIQPISFPLKPFMETVSRGSFDTGFEMLRHHVHLALDSWQPEQELKHFLSSAIYYFIGVLEEAHLESSHLQMLKLTSMNLLQSSSHQEEFLQQFENMLADFEIIVDNYRVEQSRSEIRAIKAYLEEHLSEPLDLQRVAETFGFSYNYFSSLFSSRTGETFVEFLNRIRIEKACQLLSSTALSIAQISLECGYSDSSYFSKAFKKQTGLTPRQYRKEAK